MEDPKPHVREALAGNGAAVVDWNRRVRHGGEAAAWPSGGPYDLLAVRLPRGKDELAMTLAACASVAASDARLLLYGANDEGIKSVSKRLTPFTPGRSAGVGGHCRVLAARLGSETVSARLDDWASTFDPEVPELGMAWTSFPGTFAHGSIDAATRLLLGTLPAELEGARVLDYGAGTGPVGGLCAARGAQVDLLEPDAVALHAAHINVPVGRPVSGDSLDAVGDRTYDWILSNPPIHQGKAESHQVLHALIDGAPERLEPGGRLRMVVQRRVPVEDRLERVFGAVSRVADHPAFKVVEARRS